MVFTSVADTEVCREPLKDITATLSIARQNSVLSTSRSEDDDPHSEDDDADEPYVRTWAVLLSKYRTLVTGGEDAMGLGIVCARFIKQLAQKLVEIYSNKKVEKLVEQATHLEARLFYSDEDGVYDNDSSESRPPPGPTRGGRAQVLPGTETPWPARRPAGPAAGPAAGLYS